MKKENQSEYIVKGFSNKNRIKVIIILQRKPEMTVGEIAKNTEMSFNSTSAHLLKMMATGIIMKRGLGNEVRHKLTKKGEIIFDFLKRI